MSAENMLKRKNEEADVSEQPNAAAKRVALDSGTETEALQDQQNQQNQQDQQNQQNQNDQNGQNDHDTDMEDGAQSSGELARTQRDETYSHFRMLCQVKEAALVVGKGGKVIHHIKEASQTNIKVSENIMGIKDRVIHVRGPAENVAKAFGLISRVILDEEEGVPSNSNSASLDLQLLVPHQLIGYVIGKQGLKFREIEDKSAAKLSASPQPMPFSTDRVLTIQGVADAIHIATYYVATTLLENKPQTKSNFVFYTPGNHLNRQPPPPTQHGLPPNPLLYNNMINFGSIPLQSQLMQFGNNRNHNHRNQRYSKIPSNVNLQHQSSQQQQPFINSIPMGTIGGLPFGELQISQEIYIPNDYVGNVIGKAGKNIRKLTEATGSKILIADPDPNSKGRKITIEGSATGNQTAIFLINNKIEVDKKNNEAKALQQQQQQQFAQSQEENLQRDQSQDVDGQNGN